MPKKARRPVKRPVDVVADEDIDWRKGASMKAWQTANDIPLDEEDQFHAGREKILLDGSSNVRVRGMRRAMPDDDDDEVQEVYGLDVPSSSDEDDESLDAEEVEDDDEFDAEEALLDRLESRLRTVSTLDDSDDERSKKKKSEPETGIDRAWGKSKSIFYDADDASDDEELAKEEEAEALRIQKRRRQAMREEDFFEDDSMGALAAKAASGEKGSALSDAAKNVAVESLVEDDEAIGEALLDGVSIEERDRLARELASDAVEMAAELKERWEEWEEVKYLIERLISIGGKDGGELSDGPLRVLQYLKLRHGILTNYLMNIAYYLSIRSNPSLLPAGTVNAVKTHPVTKTIAATRALLDRLERAVEGKHNDQDETEAKKLSKKRGESGEIRGMPRLMHELEQVIEVLEDDEEEDLDGFVVDDDEVEYESGAGDDDDESFDDVEDEDGNDMPSGLEGDEEEEPIIKIPKKKTKDNWGQKRQTNGKSSKKDPLSLGITDTDVPIKPLVIVRSSTKAKPAKSRAQSIDDDLVESAKPTDVDYEDKAAKRKSLQFHVKRVAGAAQAREQKQKTQAGLSGDADLPLRDRDGKIIETNAPPEAKVNDRKRKKKDGDGEGGLDAATLAILNSDIGLDDDEYDNEPSARRKDKNKRRRDEEEEGEAEEENGDRDALDFYEKVAKGRQFKKQAKEDAHRELLDSMDAEKLSQLLAMDESELGDGKRALTYQILSNKGLTPSRPKEVRNPRVKRRKKYEKAVKRLKSFKSVAVDRASMPAYAGERTGIRKGISKSVRLG
ncbi:hypothetical protein BJ742DRAFT_839733 [Cladochytrium replicatum]|nr:hypothetical protein BJ742DRAFT_839733 [Cladochytrium replicatum]